MWFKNLQLLRLTGFQYNHESLLAKLEVARLTPVSSMELLRTGWVAPRDGGNLAEKFGECYLLTLGTESKIMPGSAIKHVLKLRVKELEEQQGFAPGRKATKELKERITDEMLPRAFIVAKRTQILLDPKNGWIMIDAASASACDNAVRFLIKSLELPLESLFTKHSPATAMTTWVGEDMNPFNFTVDDEIALASGKGTLRLKGIDMRVAHSHVQSGAKVTQLALTYADKLSFMLTDTLAIKRLNPLEIMKESAGQIGNSDERYESEMLLCIDLIQQLINALVVGTLGLAERGEGQPQAEIRMAA